MGSVATRKINIKETNSDEKNHRSSDYDTRSNINEMNYFMINNNHDSNNNDNDYSKMDNKIIRRLKIVRLIAIIRFIVIISIILIIVICFYSLCE